MTLFKPLTTTPSAKRLRAKGTGPSPLFWFFAALVSLAWAFLIFSAPARAALEIGTTVKVVNQVSVPVGARVSAKTPNRRHNLGDKVVYRETVTTGEKSAVNIRLIDESTLIMGELTEMILDSLVYDPNRGIIEGSIEVLSGMFRFSTSGVKMNVTIITPVATIGVRGTEFDVLAGAEETEVVVLEGTIEITSSLGTASVTRGQVYRVGKDGRGGLQAEASAEFKEQASLMLSLIAGEGASAPSSRPPKIQTAAVTPEGKPAPQDQGNLLFMDLAGGRMVIELRPDLAPNHVRRFKELARQGVYDGLEFNFVRPGYAAETAVPLGRGDGSGETTLKGEFSDVPFERGTVGMSRKEDDPDSAESQFFITLGRAPGLDGKYTVIGKVIEGIELADKLKPGRPPKNPDRIIRLSVGQEAGTGEARAGIK
jgi:peptidylprolyl isomerase